MLNLIVAYTYL